MSWHRQRHHPERRRRMHGQHHVGQLVVVTTVNAGQGKKRGQATGLATAATDT
jgi:hypothetical protein